MIRLRPYKDSDEETILGWAADEDTFYKWSFGVIGEYPLSKEKFQRTAQYGRFTAVDEDGPVGFFTVRNPGEKLEELRFGFVIVDPDLRGRGIGQEMIRAGLTYAFEVYGAQRVSLGVFEFNDPARACYRAAGFTETEKIEEYPVHGVLKRAVEMEVRRAKNE